MLQIDETSEVYTSGKVTRHPSIEGRYVYHVAADRSVERSGSLAANEDVNADVSQVGERKSIPFKTKEIVSEGKIVISSDEDKVVFYTKVFNVTNELITGRIRYGEVGNEKDVPAGSFVPFEVLPTYNRIGSMTIGNGGQYELHLRGEYIYNWNTDDIKLQFVETIGEDEKVYEANFGSLADLYAAKDILLTPKQ